MPIEQLELSSLEEKLMNVIAHKPRNEINTLELFRTIKTETEPAINHAADILVEMKLLSEHHTMHGGRALQFTKRGNALVVKRHLDIA